MASNARIPTCGAFEEEEVVVVRMVEMAEGTAIRIIKKIFTVNPTYYGPFGATPDIRGGTMYPLLVMHVPLGLS